MIMKRNLGVIFDIQRFSIYDGPGIRTTVFLKGCYLNCKWCHNPEGKRRYPEVFPYNPNCEKCNLCIEVCPTGALKRVNDVLRIDKGLCTTCLQCVKVCKHDALVVWGRFVTVDEVIEEVLKDKEFYKHSGGGMTVSGGEPMAQPEFTYELMKAAKEHGIHTALDTCGYAPWQDFEKVLEYTDLVLYDLKVMDPEKHKEYSGVRNDLILENAKRISEMGIKMRIRVPIIPNVNDNEENMRQLGEFVSTLDTVEGLDLLPFHPWAGAKYRIFGLDYPYPIGEGYEDEKLIPLIDVLIEYVDEITVGG